MPAVPPTSAASLQSPPSSPSAAPHAKASLLSSLLANDASKLSAAAEPMDVSATPTAQPAATAATGTDAPMDEQQQQESTPSASATDASAHSSPKHKSLRVDTARAGAVPSLAVSDQSSSAASSVLPPSELPRATTQPEPAGPTTPTSSGGGGGGGGTGGEGVSAHSAHSSVQSSADCSPQAMYRGLAISVKAASSGGASTSASSSANEQTDSSDGSNAASNQTSDAMQLATPHPVPNTTTTAADSSSAAPAADAAANTSMSPRPASGQDNSSAAQQQASQDSESGKDPESASSATPGSATAATATGDASAGAESATSASATAASSSNIDGAKKGSGRYKPLRTLQNSLFGQVQLAYDTHRGVEVAVKVSHAELVAPKPQSGSVAAAGGNAGEVDAAATARSQAGVSVLEDVRREARILRLLLGSDQPPMTTDDIHDDTCGLSASMLHAIHLPANAVVQPGATNPLTIKQQFLDSIAKGKKSIAGFYEEVEAESFHYLISEFVSGGDLFSVLTAQPQHKVSEGVARLWFYQLCCSVRYLHAHSIAHLDLSLENICMDGNGHVKLIDFGLAAQHPHYAGRKRSMRADGTPHRNASHHIKLLSEPPASAACDCSACKLTEQRLMKEDPAIQAALRAGVPLAKLKFLCRPVCAQVHKPGKLGYMCPELYNSAAWDSYRHDIFGLGVILYSMLTGRPPFTRPDADADVWFRVIYSGQWLMQQVRSQPPAAIYNSLSPNALHLIDMILKPQHLRPTIDTVLKHPWLSPAHPGNAIPTVSKQQAMRAGLQMSKGKMVQRRGSD